MDTSSKKLCQEKKSEYFINFDPNINRKLGSINATLILGILEDFFKKYPQGFYKFIEPCFNDLYVPGESWSEILGCYRTTFSKAFDLIGKRHKSRSSFEKSEDKFQGKMYASYYDRHTNRTFFIRNHNLVEYFLSSLS